MNELKILLAERERRLKIKRLTLRRSCKKKRLEMKIPLDSQEENLLLARILILLISECVASDSVLMDVFK